MQTQLRFFETSGPVDPDKNYIVPRTDEVASLAQRIQRGRYIVIFAPRQTGKTTVFRWALETLVHADDNFFPLQLNFEVFVDTSVEQFYAELQRNLRAAIRLELRRRQEHIDPAFDRFLQTPVLKSHLSLHSFFAELAGHLGHQKVAMIIDEFDGIPRGAKRGFLHALRQIYLSGDPDRCPYSLGIVGVKSIAQLNYDRSISPFNVQDEFFLPNFTRAQVHQLLSQYTEETGQAFAESIFDALHHHTAGQPFLVNRMAQILTEELSIPKTQPITMTHFERAHQQILSERNVNITHLVTNIQRDKRFKPVLMRICSYEAGVPFRFDNEILNELATYGVIRRSEEGLCEIANPIY